MIVTVVVLRAPRTAPPVGLASVTVNVSAGSLIVSLVIGTTIVRLVIVGANVNVPPVLSKSTPPPVAVTPASEYWTVFWLVAGPRRNGKRA